METRKERAERYRKQALKFRAFAAGSLNSSPPSAPRNAEITSNMPALREGSGFTRRKARGVFAIQDEVTQRIVRILVAHITQSELDRGLHKAPETLAAYDYYLRGNAAMKGREGLHRGELVSAARELYEQSIATDPRYAPAIQGLAYTYITAYMEPTTHEPIAREYRQRQRSIARFVEALWKRQ